MAYDAPYGYCPTCGALGRARERRPNGDDLCDNGHKYPSASAVNIPPATLERQLRNWLDVINERAVALRDKIGTGEHMKALQTDLQEIINLSREHLR